MNSAFGVAAVFLYYCLSIKVTYNKNPQVVVWPMLATFKSIL
jgi:hypothetical protein